MPDTAPHSAGSLSRSIKTGAFKTLKNPATYIGIALIGGAVLLTKNYIWGFFIPFLIPLLIQATVRIHAEYKYQEMLGSDQETLPSDGPEIAHISDISSFSNLFHAMQDSGGPHLLIKVQINPASEVIRLNEKNGLSAENTMIKRIERIIQQNFDDGMVVKVSFNAFMIILTGNYEDHETRLHHFIDENSPHLIKINDTVYLPKFLVGITPLCGHPGESFSRLEFAIQKAFLSSGRAYWYVAKDSSDFDKYRKKRIGLRLVRHALDDAELGLYAQPIVSLNNAPQKSKYEILLRHYLTATEINLPRQILEYANFNKISQDIDLYVINLLCQNFHRISESDPKGIDTISINLTGSSFTSPRFAGLIKGLVSKYSIPKDKIVLEITETIANQNIPKAIRTMEKLKDFGFKLALDDIGIGSSNFHNLSHFPVDYYKIDRLYTEEILENSETRRFVQLIIDIGKSKGKSIIAEGIPDKETLEVLTTMGVDFSQSFLTGKPEELVKAPKFDTSEFDMGTAYYKKHTNIRTGHRQS
ncbi:MAG: EAL domain-containing protein [Emcibacter sp.]|nr:EAL domain-containing protein [Emcibacter sp.]